MCLSEQILNMKDAVYSKIRLCYSTPKPVAERQVKVNAYQIAGEIALDRPRNGVTKRYISVEFDCPGRISVSEL